MGGYPCYYSLVRKAGLWVLGHQGVYCRFGMLPLTLAVLNRDFNRGYYKPYYNPCEGLRKVRLGV